MIKLLFSIIWQRPLVTLILHNDHKKEEKQPVQHTITQIANQTRNRDIDLPLTLQCTCRKPKLSVRLKDSIEYSQQPFTYLADSNNEVPRTYHEAMKIPNL